MRSVDIECGQFSEYSHQIFSIELVDKYEIELQVVVRHNWIHILDSIDVIFSRSCHIFPYTD